MIKNIRQINSLHNERFNVHIKNELTGDRDDDVLFHVGIDFIDREFRKIFPKMSRFEKRYYVWLWSRKARKLRKLGKMKSFKDLRD